MGQKYKCNGDCFHCKYDDCVISNDDEIKGHKKPPRKPKVKKQRIEYSSMLHRFVMV